MLIEVFKYRGDWDYDWDYFGFVLEIILRFIIVWNLNLWVFEWIIM